jgi:hypothetical protein
MNPDFFLPMYSHMKTIQTQIPIFSLKPDLPYYLSMLKHITGLLIALAAP